MDERKYCDYKHYYDKLDIIGKGAFGIIFKGREKGSKRDIAIKEIDLELIKQNILLEYGPDNWEKELEKLKDELTKEFEIMKMCSENNSNSLKCYEYFVRKQSFVMVMELLCDTSLAKLLTEKIKREKRGFNSDELLEIMNQLNKAFKVMREKKNNTQRFKFREYFNKI